MKFLRFSGSGSARACVCLIVVTGALSSGCATTARTAHAEQVQDLRRENDRLEAELTELREQKLQVERGVCEKAAPQTAEKLPRPEADSDLPDLPVVKMEPGKDSSEEVEGPVVSLRPAALPEEEKELPSDVRPVLKVSGQHEAWVYHRRVTGPEPDGEVDLSTQSIPTSE
jgi:outer membrane murein-binding lipoprotein Lpp